MTGKRMTRFAGGIFTTMGFHMDSCAANEGCVSTLACVSEQYSGGVVVMWRRKRCGQWLFSSRCHRCCTT